MTSLAQSDRFVSLRLVGECTTIAIVAPVLAAHCGISVEAAVRRLSRQSTILVDHIEAGDAARLANLLRTLGAAVETAPHDTESNQSLQTEHALDISLQPIETEDLRALAASLLAFFPDELLPPRLRSTQALETALRRPAGLVMRVADASAKERIRRAVRKVPGIRFILSCPATALYDIFQEPHHTLAIDADIRSGLRLLGLSPCAMTGSVAARLDSATCEHVLNRFPDQGLFAFNRDFQRFDLYLIGTQNISPRELADFLVSRSDLPREALEMMTHPLRIESGLTRADALAFKSDYAALGLETSVKLRMPNPIRPQTQDRVAP